MYTTDQITSIAFGIQTQSFENPINEFVSQNNDNIKERSTYKVIIMLLMPRLSSLFRSEMFTQKYQTFLRSCMNRVIEERILSGLTRNDLIDTLIKLRQEADVDGVDKNQQKHYDDVLLAQASAFYLGGYETTLNTIAFALDLLAKHPEIQKRLRAEIKNVLEQFEGNITYMSVSSMQYLDMVIKECLRLYPIVAFLEREHNGKDFSLGRFSLMPHQDFSLPDRMPVFVSALGMHRDPKVYMCVYIYTIFIVLLIFFLFVFSLVLAQSRNF